MYELRTKRIEVTRDTRLLERDICTHRILACCPCQIVKEYGLPQPDADSLLEKLASRDSDSANHLAPVLLSELVEIHDGKRPAIEPFEGNRAPCRIVYARRYLLSKPKALVQVDEVGELIALAKVIDRLWPGFFHDGELPNSEEGKQFRYRLKTVMKLAETLDLLSPDFRELGAAPLSRCLLVSEAFNLRTPQMLEHLLLDPIGYVTEALGNSLDLEPEERHVFRSRVRELREQFEKKEILLASESFAAMGLVTARFSPESVMRAIEALATNLEVGFPEVAWEARQWGGMLKQRSTGSRTARESYSRRRDDPCDGSGSSPDCHHEVLKTDDRCADWPTGDKREDALYVDLVKKMVSSRYWIVRALLVEGQWILKQKLTVQWALLAGPPALLILSFAATPAFASTPLPVGGVAGFWNSPITQGLIAGIFVAWLSAITGGLLLLWRSNALHELRLRYAEETQSKVGTVLERIERLQVEILAHLSRR